MIKDGQLIGARIVGDTTDGASLFSLIKSGENISGREKEILLGVPSGGSARVHLSQNEWRVCRLRDGLC